MNLRTAYFQFIRIMGKVKVKFTGKNRFSMKKKTPGVDAFLKKGNEVIYIQAIVVSNVLREVMMRP